MINYKLLFFLIAFVFCTQTSFAQVYTAESVFKSPQGDSVQSSGVGFAIQTKGTTYFISPYHVMGGEIKSNETEDLVYQNAIDDIVIYKSTNQSIIPLFQENLSCNCLKINPIAQSSNHKYYLSNQVYALTTNNFLSQLDLEKSRFNRNSNYDNFGRSYGKSATIFDAETRSGFSGAPVIGFSTQLIGMIIKYDSINNKTVILNAQHIYELLNKIQRPNYAINKTSDSGYLVINNTPTKAYDKTLIALAGGDISDGGNFNSASNEQNDSSTGIRLAQSKKNIAYLAVSNKRYYPNQSAYQYFTKFGVNITNIAVLDDESSGAERISYPFTKIESNTLRSFEVPILSKTPIIEKSFARLENNKMFLNIKINHPNKCQIDLEFNSSGSLIEKNESFESVLNFEKCDMKVSLDLKGFFFENLDDVNQNSTGPYINIKINENLYKLEYLVPSPYETQ